MYEYMIVHSKSMGYALYIRPKDAMECVRFWQQTTKWYSYLGNLKRYHPDAKDVAAYRVVP